MVRCCLFANTGIQDQSTFSCMGDREHRGIWPQLGVGCRILTWNRSSKAAAENRSRSQSTSRTCCTWLAARDQHRPHEQLVGHIGLNYLFHASGIQRQAGGCQQKENRETRKHDPIYCFSDVITRGERHARRIYQLWTELVCCVALKAILER
jgi:hypothetical protein